jgi:Holliday junction resolvase RusA-like endonuclease
LARIVVKHRNHLRAWKASIHAEAQKAWPTAAAPISAGPLRVTIVYLCARNPADVDNIIKPILDALVGVAIKDDLLVTDIDSHRRPLAAPPAAVNLPPLLQQGIASGRECVYVRVSAAQPLRSYL